MKEYHKIQTAFKRDPETRFRTLIDGQYAEPAFEYLANNEWVFTEKVDGTNIRIIVTPSQEHHNQSNISFGGKTDAAQIPVTLMTRLDELFRNGATRGKLAEMFPDGGCLYGEGYGAKIQKGGGNYCQDQSFVLFDVKVGEWWLERPAIEDVASKLGIDVVPIIGTGTLPEMIQRARLGIQSQWGNFWAEGIVARPKCELSTRAGKRIITKIKTKDF